MNKTVVLNVVGLSSRIIGEHTPFIRDFRDSGESSVIKPLIPAVTCTAQSTYLTGEPPAVHGIVGNGWYFKEECEVKFWKQSNKLVQARKIWEVLREEDASFSCANICWWYNMYSTVDYSVTPRPNYLADGRKIPDCYTHPPELRDQLQGKLGQFPLFNFWGPKTSIVSSQWIADAAIEVDKAHDPTLSLVYLPHLDYNLQRYGINDPKIHKDLREIDKLVEKLVVYYQQKGAEVVILSEYGITDVDTPIHPNRLLREAGLLSIREERGLELLDAGASKAFAVADHQLAHIYLNDQEVREQVIALFEKIPGVGKVLSGDQLREYKLNHERCGDIVLLADHTSWFTYYYWLDDSRAPDFARMVDIHKKPGYDPVEMFTDPDDPFVMPKVIGKLLLKKIGFRTLMDIIPLKPELVRGSHGRVPESEEDYPVLITSGKGKLSGTLLGAEDVFDLLLAHLRPSKTEEKDKKE